MSSGHRKSSSTPSVGTANATSLVHPAPRGRKELAISPILPIFRNTASISSFSGPASGESVDEKSLKDRHQYRSDAVAGLQYEFEAEAFGAGGKGRPNSGKEEKINLATVYKRGFEPYRPNCGGSTVPRAAKSRKMSAAARSSDGQRGSSISLKGSASFSYAHGKGYGRTLKEGTAINFESNSWVFKAAQSRASAAGSVLRKSRLASASPRRNACSSPVINPYEKKMYGCKRTRSFTFDDLPDDVVNTSVFSGFLNSLDIVRSLILTCKRFRRLARTGVRLLDLNNTQVTDAALERLIANFPCIQDLNLSHCPRLTASCAGYIGRLRHLHCLRLKSSGITTSFFRRAHENWTKRSKDNLKTLDMSCISGAGFAACTYVFESFSNLKVLKASNLKIAEDTEELVAYNKIVKLKNLMELDVSCNPSLDGEKLVTAVLGSSFASRLKVLDLHGCMHAGGPELLMCTSRLSTLEHLNLAFLGAAPVEAFYPLERLHGLTSLNLAYTSVDDEFLERMKRLGHLKSLNISGCRSVSDAGLGLIVSYLQNLEILDCSGLHGITEGGIRALTGLPKLKCLNIQFCNPEATGKVKGYFAANHKAVTVMD
jgi:Leucine-rich repeat (LRR) protein